MSEKIQEIKERRKNFYANEGQLTRDLDFLLAEIERLGARRILIEPKTYTQELPGTFLEYSIVDADDPRLSKSYD